MESIPAEVEILALPTSAAELIISCSSFLASGDFCHLLITFANILDPDEDSQNVGPDLDPNRLIVLMKFFFKVSRQQQNHERLPACKE